MLCRLLSKGVGEGAPLDITDFHKSRGTFVDIIQPANMDRGDFLCRVRRQWDLIADDTAAVLLAVVVSTVVSTVVWLVVVSTVVWLVVVSTVVSTVVWLVVVSTVVWLVLAAV